MKKQILLITLVGIFSIPTIHPATTYAESSEAMAIQQTSRIELQGDYGKRGGFRSGTDPIVVDKQGAVLSVLFQRDVGILQVAVTNSQGNNVYATFVNTATQTTLNIPLTGLPTGNYTISFSNERGEMWGEFGI